ncbi:MAG: sensor histidine kinase [Candidatus Electrothrix sp. AW2]|nr:sensor histidine kinase [Candidatus Electrothrix gigas]MCI5135416.1 sensor histidine kinase [Candidatus Electrothrix gigas]MCI5178330.1 sensor histidine kinase [Candidatus Electrothrix gigas]MCI5194248.1 sensor histidine kinase [Candidatus Electrothrix gigas]
MKVGDSIKGRLVLWIFFAGAVMVILLDFVLLHQFTKVALHSVNNVLHSKLQIMKGLIHAHANYIEVELAEVARGEYSLPSSGHYYQVFINGHLYLTSPSLQPAFFNLLSDTPESYNAKAQEWIYRTVGPNGEPLLVLRNDFYIKEQEVSIRIAETLAETVTMLSRLEHLFYLLTPFFILLIGIVGYLISSHALRPLTLFTDALERINHNNLGERIEPNGFTRELQIFAERFNSLLERLQTAFTAEKELIANAAHELKTPLAVIRAECDIALMKERSGEEYTESLQEVRTVSDTMLRQVNGMLTLARIDSGILTRAFQPTSLNRCLDDAMELVKTLTKKHDISMYQEIRDEVTVLGDRDALTEALVNLLENAVYYNHPQGSVTVTLQQLNQQILLTVQDTGMGIPEDELEQVFCKFYRAKAVKGMQGTGLGLSITKAIVLGHQGDIKVQNVASGGVCFTITLPSA